MTKDAIRILYIDDRPLDQALVREAISNSPQEFVLIEAANKKDFKQLLAEGDYDLILSDLNILGFTGLEVLEAVQEIDPNLPVIIVTGTRSEEIAAEAIKRSAADYVIKSPEHIHRLPLIIIRVLENVQLRKQQAQIQQDLRESEERYHHLMDTIQDGIWGIDRDSRTSFVNPAMANLLGYTSEEMLGKHLFDFMDDQSKKNAKKNVERRKEGIAEKHEFEFIRKDGSSILTSLSTSPLTNGEGKYLGAVASVRDITEQKQAEISLLESKEKFKGLYENVPLAYQSLDEDGTIRDVNPTWLKILGYEREEVLGKYFGNFLSSKQETSFKESFSKFKKQGSVHDVRYKIQHKNGRFLDISFEGCIGYNPNGSFCQAYCVFADITDQVASKNELRKRERQLRDVLDATPFPVALVDIEDNQIEYWSRSALDLFGHTAPSE